MQFAKTVVVVVVVGLLVCSCRADNSTTMVYSDSLNLVYFEWPVCQALLQLCQQYPYVKNCSVDCPPYKAWYQTIFDDYGRGAEGRYDLAVLDSQFIGDAVTHGYILDVTDFWRDQPELFADFYPQPFQAYTEYPLGSGRYYGAPLEADVMILIYRKDVWQALGVDDIVSWSDLLRVCQLIAQQYSDIHPFTAFWCTNTSTCYDEAATMWNQIAWSFGGELWDPATYRVDGVLQSQANQDAVDFAKQLIAYGPPDVLSYSFTDVTDAVCSGRTAMATHWQATASDFTSPARCLYSDQLGYTIVPGAAKHILSLGGQGIHINKLLSPARIQAAKQFFEWLLQDSVQREWIRLGGLSSRKSITGSGLFLNSRPFAGAFVVSYPLVQDFWNLPQYTDMLAMQMQGLDAAFRSELSAADALNAIAVGQQRILDKAYPEGPPIVLDLVELSSAALIAILVAAGLAIAALAAVAAWIAVHWTHPVVRFSSPMFMLLTLSGLLLLDSSLFTYAQSPATTASCQFHLWLAVVGVFLAALPLLLKTWRVFRIWSASARLQKKIIPNHKLVAYVLLLLLPVLVILIVWTAVNIDAPTVQLGVPKSSEYVIACSSDNQAVYLGLLFAYLGLLGASGALLAFVTRNVYTEFNESRYVALILYNSTVLGLVLVPLVFFLTDDPTPRFLIEAGAILAWTLLVLVLLFGPKIYQFHFGVEDEPRSFGAHKLQPSPTYDTTAPMSVGTST